MKEVNIERVNIMKIYLWNYFNGVSEVTVESNLTAKLNLQIIGIITEK